MSKLNCWEIKECGRGPDGENAKKLGVCPAALPNSHNGINGGKYGGRFCWKVTGNNKSLDVCIDCNVLKQVHREEGRDFILLPI